MAGTEDDHVDRPGPDDGPDQRTARPLADDDAPGSALARDEEPAEPNEPA